MIFVAWFFGLSIIAINLAGCYVWLGVMSGWVLCLAGCYVWLGVMNCNKFSSHCPVKQPLLIFLFPLNKFQKQIYYSNS